MKQATIQLVVVSGLCLGIGSVLAPAQAGVTPAKRPRGEFNLAAIFDGYSKSGLVGIDPGAQFVGTDFLFFAPAGGNVPIKLQAAYAGDAKQTVFGYYTDQSDAVTRTPLGTDVLGTAVSVSSASPFGLYIDDTKTSSLFSQQSRLNTDSTGLINLNNTGYTGAGGSPLVFNSTVHALLFQSAADVRTSTYYVTFEDKAKDDYDFNDAVFKVSGARLVTTAPEPGGLQVWAGAGLSVFVLTGRRRAGKGLTH